MFERKKYHPKDKVKYIGNESNMIYYPPKNTRGIIVNVYDDEDRVDVEWQSGVEDGVYSCDFDDIELADETCFYCRKYPEPLVDSKEIKIRIYNNKLEIRKDNDIHTLKIKYCVFCGRRIMR